MSNSTVFDGTKGVFMANSKKEFPVEAEMLKKAMAEKGLLAEATK